MAINFPSSPVLNQVFTTPETTYVWNGYQWVGYANGVQGVQGIQGHLSNFQGTQGIQGVQGPIGDIGPQGQTGSQGAQGVQGIGAQGNQGIQGSQSAQGTQGIQGAQGSLGVQGSQGLQGNKGDQGTQGVLGRQGAQGAGDQGAQGIQGIKGDQGAQGSSGNQGSQGTLGNQGSQGTSGDQGTQGSSGNQGLQGTQGTLGNQGSQGIQGIKGDQGSQGTLGNQGSQGTSGDQGTQGSSGNQGSQGISGDQGIQGLNGDQGTQGTLGNQGSQGTKGDQGTQGSSGNQGSQGISGDQGVQGTLGNQGVQGLNGDQGVQGVNGNQGSQGISGDQGTQGIIGDQGVQGSSGNQGSQGTKGDQGVQGLNGDQGVQGLNGDQGSQGISGDQGTQGTLGDQGVQGLNGNQGSQGTLGDQGVQGSLGDQGAQGTFGDQGVQGTSGDQGVQGTQGDQGIQGLMGDMGAQGSQGDMGAQGTFGDQGVQGLQGVQGRDGANAGQGAQGAQGEQGIQGLGNQGTQGIQGSIGEQGVQGINGDQGVQGVNGNQGAQGLSNQGSQGTLGGQGSQGTQGVQATQGTQGNQGVQGLSNQGSQGLQGTQGYQGVQGNQGLQGVQGIQGLQGDQGVQGIVGDSYWSTNSVGISTISNVGIGTTTSSSKLTVSGDGYFTGVITATTFYGSAIGLSGISEGNTYYVSVDGSDSNSGTGINTPLRTVKQALSVAGLGDIIHVGVGTFTEIFPLTVPQGVGIRGAGIRATFVEPTSGTKQNDCFLMNGETEITDLTIGNMYEPGWAFRFADNMKTNIRSPYIQRVTLLNRGSTITSTDPYGFDTVHNPPVTYRAGRGVLIDGSVVQATTLQPAMLFNECTFITPNNTALKMTNGARTEWVNCFTYFADKAIEALSGNVGLASTGSTRIKVSSVTGTTPAANDQLYYFDSAVSGTYEQVGTAVTITKSAHGLTIGDRVYADFTSGTASDDFYLVSGIVGVNTFEVTSTSSQDTSGSVNYKEALGFGTITAYTTSPTTIITLQGKGEGRFQTASFVDSVLQPQDIVFVRSGVGIATANQITLADYQQFGADMRSIGSAAVFGNTGINANGLGVNLRLFAFNFGHIGSGKDFSQDVSLVNQAAEVIESNGASVSFVSIDQGGDFRVGNAFYVNEKNGVVSFGGTSFNVTSLSNLTITDEINSTTITPTSVTSGNIQLSGNTVTTTSGDLTINPSGISSTFVTGDLTVTGTVFANNSLTDGNKGDITVSNNGATWNQNTGKWGVTDVGIHTLTNVGVGTTNPTSKLTVEGDIRVSGSSTFVGVVDVNSSLKDYYGTVGAAGSILVSTGSGVSWTTPYAAGLQGVQGVQGFVGNKAGVEYVFSNSTGNSDPTQGFFRYNNSSWSSIGRIYIDNLDDLGNNQTTWYDSWAGSTSTVLGHLTIHSSTGTLVNILQVDSVTPIGGSNGYYLISVTPISPAGTSLPAPGERMSITFSRTGDLGTQGPQGTQGLQGTFGIQGSQGLQGVQGLWGDQGVQGLQGVQGTFGTQGSQGLQGVQGLQGLIGDFYWTKTDIGIHTLSSVGIGTTNPTALLNVKSTSVNDFVGLFTGSTNNDLVRITQDGLGNALRVDDQAGGTTPFVINNVGRVGINTVTPTSDLTVFGNSIVTGISTSTYIDGNPINELTGSILAISYGMALP